MVANGILTRVIRELISLTCLIIMLYDKPSAPACPQNEHTDLVGMIEAGDGQAAQQHMLEHLSHIEHTLDLNDALPSAPDFKAIFTD